MPELPDVENYRRFLERKALNRTIAGAHVGSRKILDAVSAPALEKRLAGRRLDATRRHGKYLLARLDDDGWLTFHFGMTGRLVYFDEEECPPPHDRLRLDFDSSGHLSFDNQRMLGRVGLTEDFDSFIRAKELGPDALDPKLDLAAFRDRLAGKSRGIKTALMDQSLIAGIGNVYSDEILFQARIHPAAPVDSIDSRRLERLYVRMREVLETAIANGAGSEGLPDRLPRHYLLPHRHKGGECPGCRGRVQTTKVGGRTAYYCSSCQPGAG